MTEHSWASLLIAGTIHNLYKSGSFDLSRSGVDTLVNVRTYIDRPVDKWCVGNGFSHVVPNGGPFSLDERIGALVGRLRVEMDRQLKGFVPLMYYRGPPNRPPPGAVPLLLSNFGTVTLPKQIADAELHEKVHGIKRGDPSEAHFGVTECTLKLGGETRQVFYPQYNPGLLSPADGSRLARLFTKGMHRITLDMTVTEAMLAVDPYLKPLL
jgi:hypothetical protein